MWQSCDLHEKTPHVNSIECEVSEQEVVDVPNNTKYEHNQRVDRKACKGKALSHSVNNVGQGSTCEFWPAQCR